MEQRQTEQPWLNGLTDEDMAFVKRFLLASGSLKEIAAQYGISYPTVRLRLDRLIDKIKLYDSQSRYSEFEQTLRTAHIDGKIDHATLTKLLSAYRKEIQSNDQE